MINAIAPPPCGVNVRGQPKGTVPHGHKETKGRNLLGINKDNFYSSYGRGLDDDGWSKKTERQKVS